MLGSWGDATQYMSGRNKTQKENMLIKAPVFSFFCVEAHRLGMVPNAQHPAGSVLEWTAREPGRRSDVIVTRIYLIGLLF